MDLLLLDRAAILNAKVEKAYGSDMVQLGESEEPTVLSPNAVDMISVPFRHLGGVVTGFPNQHGLSRRPGYGVDSEGTLLLFVHSYNDWDKERWSVSSLEAQLLFVIKRELR